MTWARKQKSLGTTRIQAHPNSSVGVIGRKPSGSTMTFSRLELLGASARCSHLYLINPAIVSPESQMIAKLIEPHVDDINNDFAVLASTDFLKDFVKSYFVGTLAAGLAYLAMTDNGYVWSDHFERVRSQQTRIKKPDFVFSGATTGVALMEAKGSRSGSAGAFNTTVSDGYTDQVEPHLGSSILGATATHGYCIGAWLQSPNMAELFIHHTDVPAVTQAPRGGTASNLANIQRYNFATAFTLAHGPTLGEALRAREDRYRVIPFLRFDWLGKRWVTGLGLDFLDPFFREDWWQRGSLDWWLREPISPNEFPRALSERVFAIEETRARIALLRFLGSNEVGAVETPELVPMEDSLRHTARRGEDGGEQGAIFPDGLALVELLAFQTRLERVLWDTHRSDFR